MRGTMRKRGDAWSLELYLGVDESGKKQRIYKTFRGTQKEAEKELAKLVNSYNIGELVKTPDKMTVNDLMDLWFDNHVEQKNKRQTIIWYKKLFKVHIEPSIGRIKLSKLSSIHIEKFYNDLQSKSCSSTLINAIHRTLRASFNWGIKKRILSVNPCALVEKPSLKKPIHKIWTPEETIQFFNAPSTRSNQYFLVYLIGAAAGLRKGEVLGIELISIDVNEKILKVTQTLIKDGNEPIFGTPKSESSIRAIALPETLCNLLSPHIERQRNNSNNKFNLLFCYENGNPYNLNSVTNQLKVLCREAGVKELKFHELRHTFASTLVGLNTNMKVIQEILGHSSYQVTADTYSHIALESKSSAASALQENVLKNLQGV